MLFRSELVRTGAIGPLAAKPVMEGKAVLFKKFAGIDCFDIEISERDPDRLVDIIAALEPTFGGINLEDIKAPECFYIEKRLRERMRIPVFHDDQHGTAIIVGAAITNGLRVVGKDISKVKLVCSGAGAAALACLDLLVSLGVRVENIWVNAGRNAFHLPTRGPQVFRGTIGMVIPNLETLLARLHRVRPQLDQHLLPHGRVRLDVHGVEALEQPPRALVVGLRRRRVLADHVERGQVAPFHRVELLRDRPSVAGLDGDAPRGLEPGPRVGVLLDVLEPGELVRDRAHVAAALHVVLPPEGVQAAPVATDVAGEETEVDEGEHVVDGVVVLSDAERPAQLRAVGPCVGVGELADAGEEFK